jgi:hypothetical protein
MEVVLPNSTVVVCNSYQYPDLFWALRGGGGSTFAVATKITMKAHPGTNLNAVRWGIWAGDGTDVGKEGFTKGIAWLMSVMPEWTDWGLTGHPILQRYRYNSLFTAPNKTMDEITTFLKPYTERLKTFGNTVTVQNISSAMNAMLMSRSLTLNAPIDGNKEGGPGVMSSRLLSREGLKNLPAMEKTIKFLMEKDYIVEPFNVGGGIVEKNKVLDIGLNPAWRKAIIHFSILPFHQDKMATVADVLKSYNQTHDDAIRLLDRFSEGPSAYINEVSRLKGIKGLC